MITLVILYAAILVGGFVLGGAIGIPLDDLVFLMLMAVAISILVPAVVNGGL